MAEQWTCKVRLGERYGGLHSSRQAAIDECGDGDSVARVSRWADPVTVAMAGLNVEDLACTMDEHLADEYGADDPETDITDAALAELKTALTAVVTVWVAKHGVRTPHFLVDPETEETVTHGFGGQY